MIDTSDVVAIREQAIACHLSQSSPFDALPPTLRRRFLTIDHVVDATPAEPVASTPLHTDNHHQTGEHP